MKISIIIPAYNEEKYIGSCIAHCITHAPESEIIVVDNASTDRTVEIAQSYEGVIVLHEKKQGVNFARQTGIAYATGELVGFIDADSRMPCDWLRTVEAAFESDCNLVLLSGPYIFYDQGWFGRFVVDFFWTVLGNTAYFLFGYLAIGGNSVARRDALKASGGFDPSIPFYGDDADFARRLHEVGKVKFSMDFYMYSSARRLAKDGAVKSGLVYIYNYLSVVFTHHAQTQNHRDIR